MKRITTSLSLAALVTLCALCALSLSAPAYAQNPSDPYPLTADSKPQDGVPRGEVLHFTFDRSTIFPGTTQDYWVYVPAQYKPGVGPAPCLYVNQDGIQWNAPTVFDNLIARGDMPVTIGVFVMHGRVVAADQKAALDRFNRSYEYDGLGPNYANFLVNELLPEVETRKTGDGRAIHFSHDGKDHAIGGSSSGGVAAFTAAWERPDQFSRVFSVIGTYIGLRGGNEYQTLIRKYEPKPLRIYLNDGSNDLNIYAGDWWMANQTMERALTFAGYDVRHEWGTLGHDGRQGAMLFPDAMRYLWKGWPAPVAVVGHSNNGMLGQILVPGSDWELAPSKTSGAVPTTAAVRRYDKTAYSAERVGKRGEERSRLTRQSADGKRQTLAEGDQQVATGVTLSPDQTLLYVADGASHWVWSYQIQPDGSLKYGQRYYWLHSPDDADNSGAAGMCVDRDGRLYVATKMGVQVCDQAGRVNVILPLPGGASPSILSWTGLDHDVLEVTAGNQVYRRKLNVHGVLSSDAPVRPAPPGL